MFGRFLILVVTFGVVNGLRFAQKRIGCSSFAAGPVPS